MSFLGRNLLDWTALAAIAGFVLAAAAIATIIVTVRLARVDRQRDDTRRQEDRKWDSDRRTEDREHDTELRRQDREREDQLRAEANEKWEAERRRDAEEQRRAQASQVATWFTHYDDPELSPGSPAAVRTWGAFVRNESALPVFNVRVFFHFVAAQSPASENWAAVPIGGPPERIRTMPPRSEQFIPMPDNVRTMSGQTEIDGNTYAASIEFNDTLGNRWLREPRGALRSLDTNE